MTKSLLLVSLGLLVACGGDKLLLPSEGAPATIVVIAGNDQSGRAGATLANPLVVEVTDSRDRPVEGASVAFTLNGAGSAAMPATVTTDADGHASAQLQLGPSVGAVQGVAQVTGVDGQAPQVEFTAVAVPASASEIHTVSGDNQSGQVESALGQRLVVEVTDAFGNPNQGVVITWTVTGGGSVSAPTTTTDADGRASVTRTLGSTAGVQSARASAPDLAGSPVVFTHTATAAGASRVTVVSGSNQTAIVATRLPQDLVAQVLDVSGNPVSGVTVSWVVTAGGGSVESATSTTGSNGRVSNRWTLGLLPGANGLEARVTGATAATFTATATIGPSASLVILDGTQPSSDAVVGVAFSQQPVIQLRDAFGNDVSTSGVSVTAALASGDGTLGGTATRTTGSNGRATFTNLRINGATGPHTLIFAANGHTSAVSNVIEVAKAQTTTTITSATPSPSVQGQSVAVAWSVTPVAGTPTGTVTITASGGLETCSASVATGSCALVLNGEGNRVLTATYGGDALFNGSSDTQAHVVQHLNGAPVAVSDAYSAFEDVDLTPGTGVLNNDTDPDNDPLAAEIVANPQHGTVALNANGTFTYHPNADYQGGDAFTYRASDGTLTSNTATVTITVQQVNDAPSFQIAGDQTVAADAGAQQVSNFAQVVSLGANESGQVIEAFEVELDSESAALFSQAPAISASGELTYVPSGTPGTATVKVRLRDSGGTANGGQNTSEFQSFTITMTAPG